MASRRNQLRKTARLVIAAVTAALTFSALLMLAYNPFQDQVNGGAPVPLRWPNATMTWHFNPNLPAPPKLDTTDPNVVATALSNAFTSWDSSHAPLSGQMINTLAVIRGPDQNINDPNVRDGLNVVSFSPTAAVVFPTGVIAFTEVVSQVTALSATLVDADIEFNTTSNQFSTTSTPTPGLFDVQAVATHEFGHSIGLDHSGIAHTIMFPFGDTIASDQRRSLAIDDIVGVAFLYPLQPNFSASTGTISGTITLGGSGIYASHIVVTDAATGAAVIDGLTNPDGSYRLTGVPPGNYNVLALPLAPDVFSGLYILDDFSGWTCGFGENAPPCCDPQQDRSCTGMRLQNPTNYTGKFF